MTARNEPCLCGSGRRYKDCHGSLARPASKVAFAIAGTQKGGTSALASYLYEHPELGLPAVKEAHFFDTEENFSGAEVDYARYHLQFSQVVLGRMLGDATPIYMYWEPAAARMQQYNPSMKLIMVLRNPVTRAYSHWNMERARGRDPLPFDEAIRSEDERCRAALPLQHRRFSYVDRGRYSRQLERIWALFPQRQTLVMKSEELLGSPQTALSRVTDFLGVARLPAIEPRRVHSRPYPSPMSVAARDYLREKFAGEIANLERLFGWDCADWLA